MTMTKIPLGRTWCAYGHGPLISLSIDSRIFKLFLFALRELLANSQSALSVAGPEASGDFFPTFGGSCLGCTPKGSYGNTAF